MSIKNQDNKPRNNNPTLFKRVLYILFKFIYNFLIKILIFSGVLFLLLHAFVFSQYNKSFDSFLTYKTVKICGVFNIVKHITQDIKEHCDDRYISIEGFSGLYIIELTWADKNTVDKFRVADNLLYIDVKDYESYKFNNQNIVFPKDGGLHYNASKNVLEGESMVQYAQYQLYKEVSSDGVKTSLSPHIEFDNWYLMITYKTLLPANEFTWGMTKDKIKDIVLNIQ